MSPLQLHDVSEDISIDPVTFEVLRHRLGSICLEMGDTMTRVSGSPVCSFAADFNVTIATESGEVTYVGPFAIVHGSLLEGIFKWILANRVDNPGIYPGDQFLCNDPWVGALHQCDVAVVKPIFVDDKLFCWTGNCLHHADVGGTAPGGYVPNARSVFDDPTPIPPIKIVENYRMRRDVDEMFQRHSRVPRLVGLDVRAQIAANNTCEDRLLKTIAKYGADTVKLAMRRVLSYSEDLFRKKLKELPDGIWREVVYLDGAHFEDRGIYKVAVTMTKEDDHLTFDFTGTDEQMKGTGNMCYWGAMGCIFSAIFTTLCQDIPWAQGGITRVVRAILPDGTLINARFPASVTSSGIIAVAGAIFGPQNCLIKLMATHPKYRKDILTSYVGSFPVVAIEGTDQYHNPMATMLPDPILASCGARSTQDGVDTGGFAAVPLGLGVNVEFQEKMYPLLYLYKRELKDSGGPGKFRGGTSETHAYVSHDAPKPIIQTHTATGVANPITSGISGGYPINTAWYKLKRGSNIRELLAQGKIPPEIEELRGEMEIFSSKSKTILNESDVFQLIWGGGSGYGDPLERDPNLVEMDAKKDIVSLQVAESIYGVVLSSNPLKLDLESTERLRDKIRKERLKLNRWVDAEGKGE